MERRAAWAVERTDGFSRGASHVAQLDGLRAIAVVLVLIHHQTTVPAVLGLKTGLLGVWLFYVLSGFLITGILLRAREAAEAGNHSLARAWAAFWVRRALRIFPLYYLSLAVAIAMGLGAARQDWPWYAAFAANFHVAYLGAWPSVLGHFWSLAVEEQFYLVWPAVCFFLPRRYLAPLLVACIIAAPLLRMALLYLTQSLAASIALTPSCLDGFGFGGLLALRRSGPSRWAVVCGLGLALIVMALRHMNSETLINVPLELFSFALLSWWFVGRAMTGFRGWFGRLLESRPLAYLGRISFGVYVIHFMVPAALVKLQSASDVWLRFPSSQGSLQLAYVGIVSVALASLSWHIVESPFNNLKRYFPYVADRNGADDRVAPMKAPVVLSNVGNRRRVEQA